MMRHGAKVSIGLVILLGCGLATMAQQGDPEPVPELLAGVTALFESVFAEDDRGIDDATCLPELLQAQLDREAALRLIADPAAPDLIAARSQAAREKVVDFVERLFDRGDAVESVDTARIAFTDLDTAGPVTEPETVADAEGVEQEITASGLLGIKMVGLPRAVDVSVYRLGDRWCVDPLSMQ